MDSIKVLTGQHVTIEYKSATIVDRMLALLIDSFIQIAYMLVVTFTFGYLEDSGILNSDMTIIGLIAFIIPCLLYQFLFESLWGGKTPGKMFLKIKVTNEDGTATSIGGYFLRWLIRPIDLLFFGGVGAIFIVATLKHQRLGDMAAGTIVVKTQAQQVKMNSEYYSFNENYQVKYPQASNLTRGQIQFILKTLEIPLKTNDYRENEEVDALAQKVRQLLKITEQEVSRDFLEKIIKDYNYYDSLGI